MNFVAASFCFVFDHTASESVGDALIAVRAAVSPGSGYMLTSIFGLMLFIRPMIDVGSTHDGTLPETKLPVAGTLSSASAPRGKQFAAFMSRTRCRAFRQPDVPANVTLFAARFVFHCASTDCTKLAASVTPSRPAFCTDAPATFNRFLPLPEAVRQAARNCCIVVGTLTPSWL